MQGGEGMDSDKHAEPGRGPMTDFRKRDLAAAVAGVRDLGVNPRELIPSLSFDAFKGSRIHALFLAAAALLAATEPKPFSAREVVEVFGVEP